MSMVGSASGGLLESNEGLSPAQTAWYALQTRPRFEKKVASKLAEKRLEVFLPCQSSLRQWSDRRRVVKMPLFPGYLFVNSENTLQERIAVLRTNGVLSFVGARGTGTPIPEEEIAAIRVLLRENVPFEPHPYLKVGQRARICGGSLDGVKGILTGTRGDQSLIVSVKLIQRSVAMRVSGFHVVPE